MSSGVALNDSSEMEPTNKALADNIQLCLEPESVPAEYMDGSSFMVVVSSFPDERMHSNRIARKGNLMDKDLCATQFKRCLYF